MSNRRRPRAPQPLRVPSPLDAWDWSDQPAAEYPQRTVQWLLHRLRDPLAEARASVNVYTCEDCGADTWHHDLHPGVTPSFLSHQYLGDPGCPGTCVSRWYRVPQLPEVCTWEWYRPSATELQALRRRGDRGMVEHVERGGLIIRKRTPAPGNLAPLLPPMPKAPNPFREAPRG